MTRPSLTSPVVLLCAALTAGWMFGCAGRSNAPRADSSGHVIALEPRIDAVPGRTLLIPIDPEGPINPNRPIAGRLDDGTTVSARVYWISVAPEDGPPPLWLQPAGRWEATPASADTRPVGRGQWFLVVDVPSASQGLWIGGQRLPLNWLPDPATLADAEPAWRSPALEAQRNSPTLQHLADPERLSPLRRWRYHLLMHGLGPAPQGVADPDAMGDPVIEAMAAQLEGRWRIAIARLWEANAELAERVKRRLAAVVDLGEGISAPAWPPAGPDIDQLLRDLLNPALQPGERASLAASWLDGQAPAVAWVVDDAGSRDGVTGASIGSIGIANLSERGTLAWAAIEPRRAAPELVPVGAMSTARVEVRGVPPAEATNPPRPSVVRASAGRWSTRCAVLLDRLPVTPPGLRLEPLMRDQTMDQWLAGSNLSTESDDNAWATAILLHQPGSTVEPAPVEAPAGTVLNAQTRSPGGQTALWWIYGECRSPVQAGPASDEIVRIWLGPAGRPLSVIRISSSGSITDEGPQRQAAASPLVGARVVREPGKWTFQVPVADRGFETDGVLRIGVERTDARGVRRAWPRPMLPWQAEPGRAAASVREWGALAPASAAR